jgi:hypothetical protein
VAEEWRKISERTKVALAAAKARGTKLGMHARSKFEVRRLSALGAQGSVLAATSRYLGPIVLPFLVRLNRR